MQEPQKPVASQASEVLMSRKERTVKALERCKRMHDAIEKYLAALHIEHVAVDDLDKIVHGYDATCEKLDDKILVLEKQLKDIEEEIQKEKVDTVNQRDKLDWLRKKKVSLSLLAEKEGEVELILVYGKLLNFRR